MDVFLYLCKLKYSDMNDYSDLMLVDKNSGKLKDLEDALGRVEVTFAHWLNKRENIHTGEKPDRLGNYYRYFSDLWYSSGRGQCCGPYIRDNHNRSFGFIACYV